MKNNANLWVKIIVGVLFSIVILILVASNAMDKLVALITFIVFITIMFILRERGPKPDERTRRLDYRAVYWSWLLTLTFICLYILDHYYFRTVSLTSIQLAGLILYFMVFSNLIIKLIFRKRSDVSD